MRVKTGLLCSAALLLGSAVALCAEPPLPPDGPIGSKSLPSTWSKHWIWVNDFVFPHMTDGMAYLIDGDNGEYLGTLSTGASFVRVLLPASGDLMYSPETYFSRGTRGIRTDVVTLYDRKNLKAVGEIIIPPKRSSNLPMMSDEALTDDDRFLLIYNFDPKQSVTVVDTQKKIFVGEIDIGGCALVYPTGPRSFFSLCGNGAALAIDLTDTGAESKRVQTEPLFEAGTDPVSEKGVRLKDTWYFASFDGEVYPIVSTANGLVRGAKWALTTPADRKQGWRPGGMQHLAVHEGRHELYSIMHQGPLATHKDPGSVVWVYDLNRKARVRTIPLKSLSSSILLSSDDHPLLFSIFIESSTLDIYDPVKGAHLRSVEHVGTTPALLVSAP